MATFFGIAAVLAAGVADGAAAQSCVVYETGFEATADPADLADGAIRVDWCLAGAARSATGFCATGATFKLDAAGDDPVVLVSVAGLGCAAVSIEFTYAQFAASGTIVRAGRTDATTASCALATPIALGALAATGGACTAFSATVPLDGADAVVFRLDHGANANAILIDDLVIRRIGCCGSGTHACCETGTAACSDAAVAACVCGVDPYCCEVAWDAQCVAEVESLGCGSCAPDPPACASAFATDFGSVYSGLPVCTTLPDVFESCEGTAPFLTSSLGCTGTGDMALRFAQGFPYSAAITRCLDLRGFSRPLLVFRYSKEPGTLGPRLDYSLDGGAWSTGWTAPVAFPGGCAEIALDLGPIAAEGAVRFRFSSGSSVANLATFDDLALVEGDTGPHGCCETGGPGCDDAATSACTCAIDSYCCETEWDVVCAALATIHCGAACADLPVCGSPTAGDCGEARATPACEDAACCLAVCASDAFCCEAEWDAICVKVAGALCEAPPRAPGDVDGDGVVGAADLAAVLAAWGTAEAAADLDGNGVVDGSDLAVVLGHWG